MQFNIVWIFFHSSSPRFAAPDDDDEDATAAAAAAAAAAEADDATVTDAKFPPALMLPLFRCTSVVDDPSVLVLVPLLLPLFEPRISRSSRKPPCDHTKSSIQHVLK